MANVTINSYTTRLRKRTCVLQDAATGISSQLAIKAATNAANNATPTTASTSNYSNTTEYNTEKRFGAFFGAKSTEVYTPYQEEGQWKCGWKAWRDYYQSQVFVNFTIPSGINSNNISTATITINTNNSTKAAAGETFKICAPKTSSSNIPTTAYTEVSNDLVWSTQASFNGVATLGYTYTVTITNQFKKCCSNNKGWLLITLPNAEPTGYTKINSVSISYTLNYTKCGAPTSIGSSTAIEKPNTNININWSGAQGGTNNPITGYTIYWRIDAAPTTTTFTGIATSNSSPYTFTIPNNATRNSTYYFKIVTNGTVSGYNSDISSASVGVVVNSLPSAPSVSVNKTRFKSTGGTVTFTTIPGTDVNTSQNCSVYWATSPTGTKTEVINNSYTTDTLTNETTYYFWTYDGLEYSSSYASQTITKNTRPTIGSITMSPYNNITYIPSTVVSGVERQYVKNINGSANGVIGNNLTYQWKLCVGNSVNATSYNTETDINTEKSLSNIDVTFYGADFNTAYKLKLTVTDDLEEYYEAYSSDVFIIAAAPSTTMVNLNNTKQSTGVGNPAYFEKYIRVSYNQNTGITKQLQYCTDNSFSNNVITLNLNEGTNTDVDLSTLSRGTTYYFRPVYICNAKIFNGTVQNFTRALDITPNITGINPKTGTNIKPYFHEFFTCVFTNQPINWVTSENVSTNYNDIYTIKVKNGNQSLTLTSTGNISQRTVTSTITLNDKNVENWIALINGSGNSAPMGTYNITLEITATNIFGESFSNTANFVVDFREPLIISTNPTLKIKTNRSEPDSPYVDIPNQSGRYPLFATQTIQFNCAQNSLQSYVNQPAVLNLYINNSKVGESVSISASDWTRISGSNFKYYLNTDKILNYLIPSILVDNDIVFKIELSYNNTNYSAYSTNTGNTFNYCKYVKINTSQVNFEISSISETLDLNSNPDEITIKYIYSANGGGTGAYQSQTATFIYTTSLVDNSYSTFKTVALSNPSSSEQTTFGNSSTILGDILYFGATINLIAAFQDIDGAYPTGTDSYSVTFLNLKTLYRTVPNLIYGKNFFGINTNSPGNNTDGILYIYQTNSRTKIYFGNDNTNFEITDNGLIIDGGTWS